VHSEHGITIMPCAFIDGSVKLHASQAADLLDLAAELRVMIWELVLRAEDSDPSPLPPIELGIVAGDDQADIYPIESPSIARVCRQIRNEVLPIYYADRSFRIAGKWLQGTQRPKLPIPPKLIPTLQTLQFQTHPIEQTYIVLHKPAGNGSYMLSQGGAHPLRRLSKEIELRIRLGYIFLQYLTEQVGVDLKLHEHDLETLMAILQYPYKDNSIVESFCSTIDCSKKLNGVAFEQFLASGQVNSLKPFDVELLPLSQVLWNHDRVATYNLSDWFDRSVPPSAAQDSIIPRLASWWDFRANSERASSPIDIYEWGERYRLGLCYRYS
jgi:hypothetical protein